MTNEQQVVNNQSETPVVKKAVRVRQNYAGLFDLRGSIVYILCCEEGLDRDAIADLMESSRNDVDKQIHRLANLVSQNS